MKSLMIALVLALMLTSGSNKKLKPYILGAQSSKDIATTETIVKQQIKAQGLVIVGSYTPAADANRRVVCFTSPELKKAAAQIGGLTGFAAALRIGITKEGGVVNVSYTNPFYWGNAYYRDDYPKVEKYYITVYNKLIRAMKLCGTYKGQFFGSEEGVEIDDLREYQYMFGMPEFDDVVELKTFSSYQEAVAKVEANLKKSSPDYKKVYAVEIPGKNLKVYGIALTGAEGEKEFMPIIDISKPKHTAFLPYEILVKGKEVVMLHGRFRIALSFPDLTMGTFSKIMSTPGNIEDVMEKIVE